MWLCYKTMGTKEDQQKAQRSPQCLHKESLKRKYSWPHRAEEWQLQDINMDQVWRQLINQVDLNIIGFLIFKKYIYLDLQIADKDEQL